MWEKIKAWFKFADLNNDNKVTAEDLELARALSEKKIREANEAINAAATEVKTRVKRVKEELADVKDAVEEVTNQLEDVAAAAKGKARAGRKKKQ